MKRIEVEEILKELNIPDNEDTRAAFWASLNLLLYMNQGSVLETPHARIKRSSHRVLTIDQDTPPKIGLPEVLELLHET